jgi:hypothetical protein
VIIKESWTVEAKRFKGVLVKAASPGANKLLFSQSFSGIRSLGAGGYDINSIALAINSILAVYYFLLTGARMGSYRPTLLLDDIREFPLPECAQVSMRELSAMTEGAIDGRVKEIYGLKDAEWVLVEDLFKYTLRDFKGGLNSPGRRLTRTMDSEVKNGADEAILMAYCEYLKRVLRAGFGEEKEVCATIFREGNGPFLPVRMVAIHLHPPAGPSTRVEKIDSLELLEKLKKLDQKFLKSNKRSADGGIFYQRVARVYDTVLMGDSQVPTVFIVKPDQVRYWTRSMALRDADEIAGDIMLWREGSATK